MSTHVALGPHLNMLPRASRPIGSLGCINEVPSMPSNGAQAPLALIHYLGVVGWPRPLLGPAWAQGTAAGQTHGHVEAATAPTWHHVPLWHPFSPLGSAMGAPLGTTMLDWAQVGTCGPAAQLTHPGCTPLSGKHLAIPKTSPLHRSEHYE